MSISLSNVGSGFKRTALNGNFEAIEAELNSNVLRRDGVTGANQLEVDIDMNSNDLLNAGSINTSRVNTGALYIGGALMSPTPLSDASRVIPFATLLEAASSENIIAGDSLNIAERTTGNGGGAMWDVVLSSTVTENTFNIVQCTGVGTLSLVLRVGRDIFADQFGAIGDDANAGVANQLAFDSILTYMSTNGGRVLLGPKVYYVTGVIDLWRAGGQSQAVELVGTGSFSTELFFSSYVSGQTTGIDLQFNRDNVVVQGMTIRGAGKAVLNDASAIVYGFSDLTGDISNGLTCQDLAFRDWSGDGANIRKFFQQRWIACYARDCGGWGIVIDGDQSPYFNMTGSKFLQTCDSGGLWIKKGNAIVRGWNGEKMPIGLKCGNGSANRVRLDISGANFEQMNAGSTAIDMDEYSQIINCVGTVSQGPEVAAATALYGIRFRRLNGYNNLQDYRAVWFSGSSGSGIDIPIQIDVAEPDSVLVTPNSRDDLITMGFGTTLRVQGAGRLLATKVRANIFDDNVITAVSGVYQQGRGLDNSIVHSVSADGATLDLDSAGVTHALYYLDSDTGNLAVSLPSQASGNSQDLTITFKRISAANTVTLNTASTQTIDGVDNWSLAAQYDSITINKPADKTEWFIIRKV